MERKHPYLFFDPALIDSLEHLSLSPGRPVEGQVAGAHGSRHRGMATDFAEYRAYVPGDDLRYLDWKIFGRTDKRYVRQFEDERDLVCYVALDTSASMSYRHIDSAVSKFDYARQLAASLVWIALRQRDAVTVVPIGARIGRFAPPSARPSQLAALLERLARCRTAGKTGLGSALQGLASRLRRRGLVVVLTDGFTELESLVRGLQSLRVRGHDVWLWQVLDPAELDFPFDRPFEFRGLEGETPVTADGAAVVTTYRELLTSYLARLRRLCQRRNILIHTFRSDQPVAVALSTVLGNRL